VKVLNYELIAIAGKLLKPVEINAFQSNQHEFHGVNAFKHIFGQNRIKVDVALYHIDSDNNIEKSNCEITWYDAREYDPIRSEYRLYYKNNYIFSELEIDDMMLLAKSSNGALIIIFIKNNSPLYKYLIGNLTFIKVGAHFILDSSNDINIVSTLWGLCDNNKKLSY